MTHAYRIGYSAENDLHNRLMDIDFAVMRAYKSHGPFDLMAFTKDFRPLLIEVKYYKVVNEKVIKRLKKTVNIRKLIDIAKEKDAYPIIAFKIRRKGYRFYRLDNNTEHNVKFKDMYQGLRRVLYFAPEFK